MVESVTATGSDEDGANFWNESNTAASSEAIEQNSGTKLMEVELANSDDEQEAVTANSRQDKIGPFDGSFPALVVQITVLKKGSLLGFSLSDKILVEKVRIYRTYKKSRRSEFLSFELLHIDNTTKINLKPPIECEIGEIFGIHFQIDSASLKPNKSKATYCEIGSLQFLNLTEGENPSVTQVHYLETI